MANAVWLRLRNSLGGEQAAMMGRIRLGAPPSFGATHLVRAIQAFCSEYPEVRVDIASDDGNLSLMKEGLDLSIRIAPDLKDTSLVRCLLVRIAAVIGRFPGLSGHTWHPAKPEDLARHDCLQSAPSTGSVWAFEDNTVVVSVSGPLFSNPGEALRPRGQGSRYIRPT
jgi:DNA-binding transcriptional LysR family regulator